MKKKKILCSLLCGAILLSVAGCGKGDTQSPADMEREQSEAVLKEETQDTNLNAEGLPVLREPETFRIAVMKNVMSKNTFPEKALTYTQPHSLRSTPKTIFLHTPKKTL